MTRGQVTRLLGDLPTDPWGKPYDPDAECSTCKATFSAKSIAWGTYDYHGPDEGYDVQCISCALADALDREAEDET